MIRRFRSATGFPREIRIVMFVDYFVEKSQNTQLPFDKIDTGLIIEEFDERPINLLSHIFFLLKLEDVLIELHNLVIS